MSDHDNERKAFEKKKDTAILIAVSYSHLYDIAYLEGHKSGCAAAAGPVQDVIMTECLQQQQRDIAAFHTSTGNTEPALDGPYAAIADFAREMGSFDPEADERGLNAVIRRQHMVDSASPSSPLSEEKAVKLISMALATRIRGASPREYIKHAKDIYVQLAPHLSDTSAEKARVDGLVEALRRVMKGSDDGKCYTDLADNINFDWAKDVAREALDAFERGE